MSVPLASAWRRGVLAALFLLLAAPGDAAPAGDHAHHHAAGRADATGLQLVVHAGAVRAGEPATLHLVVEENGVPVRRFDVVHEKPLHLIVVSGDLSWFSHLHPVPQGDGTFLVTATFPAGGRYRLFADVRPGGQAAAVLRSEIVVAGAPAAPRALVADAPGARRTVGTVEVALATPSPVAGVPQRLRFVVSREGRPVTDFAPVLGAPGHLVLVGAAGDAYVHAHPEARAAGHGGHGAHGAHGHHGQPTEVTATTTPGEVAFVTTFPAPGLYKAWLQVAPRRGDGVAMKDPPVLVEFVVAVGSAR